MERGIHTEVSRLFLTQAPALILLFSRVTIRAIVKSLLLEIDTVKCFIQIVIILWTYHISFAHILVYDSD